MPLAPSPHFSSVWDVQEEEKGKERIPLFFCEDTETVLQAIALIELAKKGWVESVPTNNRVWSVLVNQIIALVLQLVQSVL